MTLRLIYDVSDEQWIAAAKAAESLKAAVQAIAVAKYPAWFSQVTKYRPDLKEAMREQLGSDLPGRPPVLCAAGCGRPARAKRHGDRGSMCIPCSARRLKGRPVGPQGDRVVAKGRNCAVQGCLDEQYAKELCNLHWRRRRTWGSTGGPERLRRNWWLDGFSADDMRACKEFVYGKRPDRPLTDEGIRLRIDYEAIIRKDPCAYCGGPAGEVDHIEPLKRGGSSEWDNLGPACRSCNSSKHATPLLAYLLGRNGR